MDREQGTHWLDAVRPGEGESWDLWVGQASGGCAGTSGGFLSICCHEPQRVGAPPTCPGPTAPVSILNPRDAPKRRPIGRKPGAAAPPISLEGLQALGRPWICK